MPVRPRESVSHVPEPVSVQKSQSVTPTPPPRPISQSASLTHSEFPALDDWAAKIHPRAVLIAEDELFTPLQGGNWHVRWYRERLDVLGARSYQVNGVMVASSLVSIHKYTALSD